MLSEKDTFEPFVMFPNENRIKFFLFSDSSESASPSHKKTVHSIKDLPVPAIEDDDPSPFSPQMLAKPKITDHLNTTHHQQNVIGDNHSSNDGDDNDGVTPVLSSSQPELRTDNINELSTTTIVHDQIESSKVFREHVQFSAASFVADEEIKTVNDFNEINHNENKIATFVMAEDDEDIFNDPIEFKEPKPASKATSLSPPPPILKLDESSVEEDNDDADNDEEDDLTANLSMTTSSDGDGGDGSAAMATAIDANGPKRIPADDSVESIEFVDEDCPVEDASLKHRILNENDDSSTIEEIGVTKPHHDDFVDDNQNEFTADFSQFVANFDETPPPAIAVGQSIFNVESSTTLNDDFDDSDDGFGDFSEPVVPGKLAPATADDDFGDFSDFSQCQPSIPIVKTNIEYVHSMLISYLDMMFPLRQQTADEDADDDDEQRQQNDRPRLHEDNKTTIALRNVDNSKALDHQWLTSMGKTKLVTALGIDPRNIVIANNNFLQFNNILLNVCILSL